MKPFIFPPILYFYYNREEGKEKEHTRNQVCSILMVNAKTFRTMKKSLYLRIMVDLKGIEPSTSRMRTERPPKLSYKPEYMCQEKRFEQTQLNREERGLLSVPLPLPTERIALMSASRKQFTDQTEFYSFNSLNYS